MPKLPHLSGADIQRALERLGFQRVRQNGSHVVMKRESKGCVVPMHAQGLPPERSMHLAAGGTLALAMALTPRCTVSALSAYPATQNRDGTDVPDSI